MELTPLGLVGDVGDLGKLGLKSLTDDDLSKAN